VVPVVGHLGPRAVLRTVGLEMAPAGAHRTRWLLGSISDSKKAPAPLRGGSFFGAGGGTRTHTLLPGTDFECFDYVCPPQHSAVVRPPQTLAITSFFALPLDFSTVSKMP